MASMISTTTNPFDPRTDFGAWYMWDVGNGYNTSSYLARVASLSEDFPDVVIERQIEEAIDEIIAMHNGELYIKLKIEDVTDADAPAPVPSSSTSTS